MRLPIRNHTDRLLHIFIEPWCDDYEVLPGGEAFVDLEDGHPHSIDVQDGQVTIWNEGAAEAGVEIVPKEAHDLLDALRLARTWLYQLKAVGPADAMDDAISHLEGSEGHLRARAMVFAAFHDGFRAKEAEAKPKGSELPSWSGKALLAPAWITGGTAAWLNRRARRRFAFPDRGVGPFDTETVRSAFARAAGVADDLGVA